LCSPISSVRKYFIYSKEYRQENRKQDELIYPLEGKNSSNDQHEIKVGVASPADVSPNTPKADEANL
jgi:hypothetical protein